MAPTTDERPLVSWSSTWYRGHSSNQEEPYFLSNNVRSAAVQQRDSAAVQQRVSVAVQQCSRVQKY